MKKKITALALAAVMVLGLTACGGGAASSGTASTGAGFQQHDRCRLRY